MEAVEVTRLLHGFYVDESSGAKCVTTDVPVLRKLQAGERVCRSSAHNRVR